jgi:hypothetical protein
LKRLSHRTSRNNVFEKAAEASLINDAQVRKRLHFP